MNKEPAANIETYTIYGSGDPGTIEIKQAFFDLAIPIKFRDIRDGDLEALIFVNDRGFKTIPQVYAPDGVYIGNYEETIHHLNDLPNERLKRKARISQKELSS